MGHQFLDLCGFHWCGFHFKKCDYLQKFEKLRNLGVKELHAFLSYNTIYQKKVICSNNWRAMPSIKYGLDEYLAQQRIEKIKILGAHQE